MAESVCAPIASSDYQSLTLRIKELEEIVAELKRVNEAKAKVITDQTGVITDQAAIIAEQAKQIEELKAKLAKYENPPTPSSAQRYKKESESRNSSKRRGAPNGHRGATRPALEPDRVVAVTAGQCDHCGSVKLSVGILTVPALSMAGGPIISFRFYRAAGRT